MREVVGVAVVDGGRVLAARRVRPAAMAGQWELPGGKVEPGEDLAETAVREIAEELGCAVTVTGWLDGESEVGPGAGEPEGGEGGLCLRIATAELTSGAPVPAEHDAVRWLRADQLADVTWAEADRPFLPQIHLLLSQLLLSGR